MNGLFNWHDRSAGVSEICVGCNSASLLLGTKIVFHVLKGNEVDENNFRFSNFKFDRFSKYGNFLLLSGRLVELGSQQQMIFFTRMPDRCRQAKRNR